GPKPASSISLGESSLETCRVDTVRSLWHACMATSANSLRRLTRKTHGCSSTLGASGGKPRAVGAVAVVGALPDRSWARGNGLQLQEQPAGLDRRRCGGQPIVQRPATRGHARQLLLVVHL